MVVAALQPEVVVGFTKKLIQEGLEDAICNSIEVIYGEAPPTPASSFNADQQLLLSPLSDHPMVQPPSFSQSLLQIPICVDSTPNGSSLDVHFSKLTPESSLF